jgi:hypothetical protein
VQKLFIFFLSIIILRTDIIANESSGKILTSDLMSPITTDAIYILGAGTLLTATILLDKHDLDGQTELEHQYESPLGVHGQIGEVMGWGFLNGLYLIGFGSHGYFYKSKLSKERFEIMLSSSTYSILTTSLLKISVNRPRPWIKRKKDSFPSGHAALGFNFASVVTAEHGIYWGIPAYVLAAGISYSRVHDGWHWLSDIIAGATIGLSYGWGVYLNRRKHNSNFWFSIMPGIEKDSVYAQIVFKNDW